MPKGIYKHKAHSKETKRKMRLAHKGEKNHFFGKKHTEETKKKMRGKNNHLWKGGSFKDGYGYILILAIDHPFRTKRGYVRRSRLVMEKKIGRYLTPEEIVHHRNEIKNDDKPKNLKLFSNRNEHMGFHHCLKKGETNAK